jgi:hypothetical protein
VKEKIMNVPVITDAMVKTGEGILAVLEPFELPEAFQDGSVAWCSVARTWVEKGLVNKARWTRREGEDVSQYIRVIQALVHAPDVPQVTKIAWVAYLLSEGWSDVHGADGQSLIGSGSSLPPL